MFGCPEGVISEGLCVQMMPRHPAGYVYACVMYAELRVLPDRWQHGALIDLREDRQQSAEIHRRHLRVALRLGNRLGFLCLCLHDELLLLKCRGRTRRGCHGNGSHGYCCCCSGGCDGATGSCGGCGGVGAISSCAGGCSGDGATGTTAAASGATRSGRGSVVSVHWHHPFTFNTKQKDVFKDNMFITKTKQKHNTINIPNHSLFTQNKKDLL